jgi:hypothetical protein
MKERMRSNRGIAVTFMAAVAVRIQVNYGDAVIT